MLAISIDKSHVEIPASYTKKKNVFRLTTELGSEYLYQANSRELFENWVDTISGRQKVTIAAAAVEGIKRKDTVHDREANHILHSDGLPSHGGSRKSSDTKDSDTSGNVNQRKSSVLEKWLNRKIKQ